MDNFYKGDNLKEILKLLLLKSREQNLSVNILCKDIKGISDYLWNNSIPHYIDGDAYMEKNHIFVSELEKPADIVIGYEKFEFHDVYKCKKKCFIGNCEQELNGKYWQYKAGKWKEITKKEYYD